MSYTPRLKEKYNSTIVPNLQKEFGYKSVMQVPRLVKICLNQGIGAAADKKLVDAGVEEMTAITGQKAVPTKSKKDISNFKVRKGMPIGVRVTLRGERMYEFLDRLISVAIPRIRDFHGISDKGLDGKGNFSNVQFKLYNGTDAYYVIAKKASDGLYYVTGKTTEEKKATTFTPDAKGGSLVVNGLEADSYQLTEVATDDGYSLLKDQIVIDITATDRDVIASVAGVTGMDKDAAKKIIENYRGGIYDENGNLVNSQLDEITGAKGNSPANETANGRTIGKTDMYVGAIQPASSTVDEIDATMTDSNGSVLLSVENSKGSDSLSDWKIESEANR